MASEFDIVIRGGTVMDGNGGTPFTADVAVKNGKIADVGTVSGRGAEEIDAAGLAVTPAVVVAWRHHRCDGQLRRRLRPRAPRHAGQSRCADGRGGGPAGTLPERRPRLDVGIIWRVSDRFGTPA